MRLARVGVEGSFAVKVDRREYSGREQAMLVGLRRMDREFVAQ